MPKIQAALIYTKRQTAYIRNRTEPGRRSAETLSAAFAAAALLTASNVINCKQFPATPEIPVRLILALHPGFLSFAAGCA